MAPTNDKKAQGPSTVDTKPVVSADATDDEDSKPAQTCASCGTKGQDLKRCTACKSVHYCNRECQKSHRRAHKVECKKREKQLRLGVALKRAIPDDVVDDMATAAEGDTCWICMDDGADANGFKLMRGCGCRGNSGWVHPTCTANFADVKCTELGESHSLAGRSTIELNALMNSHYRCYNCKKSFHGPLGFALAEAFVLFSDDAGAPQGSPLWALSRMQLSVSLVQKVSQDCPLPIPEDEPSREHLVRAKDILEDMMEILGIEMEITAKDELRITALTKLAKCYFLLGDRYNQVLTLQIAREMASRPHFLGRGGSIILHTIESEIEHATGQKYKKTDTYIQELRDFIEVARSDRDIHPEVAFNSIRDLMLTLAEEGRYLEAMKEADDAVLAARREFGKDHQGVTRSLEQCRDNLISAVHTRLQKNMPPVDTIRRDLSEAEMAEGKDCEAAFRIRNHLVAALAGNGRIDEAIKENEELLEDAKAALGEEHELIPLIEYNGEGLKTKSHPWFADSPPASG